MYRGVSMMFITLTPTAYVCIDTISVKRLLEVAKDVTKPAARYSLHNICGRMASSRVMPFSDVYDDQQNNG